MTLFTADNYLRFSWFYSVPSGKYQVSTLSFAMTASFHILSNSPFTCHPVFRSYVLKLLKKRS
jgi:hypothetical protein